MGELAAELSAGLMRLRRGYIDAAEALLDIIDPHQDYPLDFVVFKITGYRPRRERPTVALPGKTLPTDLMRLMLDVSSSFSLEAASYKQRVYDTDSLARHFRVTTRTIQRWRRQGLPARKMVFPDGIRRVGFIADSLRRFVRRRRRQVMRSVRFSQLGARERADVIRRAKRMAAFTRCSLADITRRLAARTGRARETIRYTLRKHDRQNPRDAIFPYLAGPLDQQQRAVIYQCFLHGVSVAVLARKYGRTRGSIYRVINETRARQLLQRSIDYMPSPEFDSPDAFERILGSPLAQPAAPQQRPRNREELPPYLASLYDESLLTASQERDLFRRYNFLKYRADSLRKGIDLNRVRTVGLREIERLLVQANVVKNTIVRSNLRLVVAIARKHLHGPQTLGELVSDGNMALLHAVEKFDYTRGNRFSTYASWAIMRTYARSVPRERFQLDRFATGKGEFLDVENALGAYDPGEINLPELRESLDALLAQLSPRERTILVDHFGLDAPRSGQTLNQLGEQLGLSKERVRQIEIQALGKLRRIARPVRDGLV
jgi:RNA polymerase sigma factor (sigma-70 family)